MDKGRSRLVKRWMGLYVDASRKCMAAVKCAVSHKGDLMEAREKFSQFREGKALLLVTLFLGQDK